MDTSLSSYDNNDDDDDDDTDSNSGSCSSLDVDVAHWRRELPPRKWMPVVSPRDEARMAQYLARQAMPPPPGHTRPCLCWTGPERVRWKGQLWYIRRLVYELCIGTMPAAYTCLAGCSAGTKTCIEPTHLRAGPRPQPLRR